MTGILMCAAGLPVCLTRAPKPILNPPAVSKSDLKPVPGINSIQRKTKKKHLRKGEHVCVCLCVCLAIDSLSDFFADLSRADFVWIEQQRKVTRFLLHYSTWTVLP